MAEFRLARLPRNVPIANPKTGHPTLEFQRWWQSFAEQIEEQEARQDELIEQLAQVVEALEAAVAAIQAAQAAAEAAQAAADAADAAAAAAQTAADNAQTAVDAIGGDYALSASYPDGITITAADVGTTATITISAHTRYYGDGSSVSVNGGTITGVPFSADRIIYYDDASRAGGAVSYQATTDPTTAAQTGNRHTVGYILTPADGAASTTGSPVLPPGSYAIVLPF